MNDTSVLPKGWTTASLHDLTGWNGLMIDGDWIETKDQDPNGDVRLIQLADIGDGIFFNRSSRFLTRQKADELRCTYLKPGDVLIARMPDPLGRACIFPGVGQEAVTAVDVCVWRAGENSADPEWIKYLINSPQVREQIARQASGTTRQRISGGNLKRLEVPVPPLDEQRRMVARLDALMAHSRRAREELGRVPGLVERQRQAVLEQAFSGELTREWRKQNRQESWAKKLIRDIVKSTIAGKNLRCEERPPKQDEYGVLKISAVTWGRFDYTASKTLPSGYKPSDITRVQKGDLLISRANTLDLVGSVAIVDEVPDNLFLSDKVLRLEVDDKYKLWLMWFLKSPRGRSAIESRATGNQLSMRNLSQSALFEIELPWPSDKEQYEIVSQIEAAFAGIDAMTREAERAMALLDRLDQATLAKAFRGKL